jgi:hypothetical protein
VEAPLMPTSRDPRPADVRIDEALQARLTYDAEPAGHSPQMWLTLERALSETEQRALTALYRQALGLPALVPLSDEQRVAAREARRPKRVAWIQQSEEHEDDVYDLTGLG